MAPNLSVATLLTVTATAVMAAPAAGNFTKGRISCVEHDGHAYVIGAASNRWGEYAPSSNASLVVEMDVAAAAAGPVDIFAKSGDAYKTYPVFGAVVGPGSLSEYMGSSDIQNNYLLLTATKQTGLGQSIYAHNLFTAETGYNQLVQSTIWHNDGGHLIPQWHDPDGTTPDLHVVYVNDPRTDYLNGVLAITSNIEAFSERYGAVKECRLTFNPTRDL